MVLATTLSFVLLSSVLILFTVAMSRSSEMWHSYGWRKKPAVTRNTVRKGTHVLCIPITLDHSLDEVRLASSPLYEPTLYSESVIPLPSASASMSTVEDSHIDSSLVSRSSTCFICPLRCT